MDYGDLLSLHQNMVFIVILMDYVVQMVPSSRCSHICSVMDSMFWHNVWILGFLFRNLVVSYGFKILLVLLFSDLIIIPYVPKPPLMISSDWNPTFLLCLMIFTPNLSIFNDFQWLEPNHFFPFNVF
jgi:hypothetical protein